MRKWPFSAWLMLAALLALPIFALSQAAQQNLSLIVNGRPGVAPVVQLNGRCKRFPQLQREPNYIDIAWLHDKHGAGSFFDNRARESRIL